MILCASHIRKINWSENLYKKSREKMLSKIKQTFGKIRSTLGFGLSAQNIENIEEDLLAAGLAPSLTSEICKKLSIMSKNATPEECIGVIKKELQDIVSAHTDEQDILLLQHKPSATPYIIMLVGVNGNGKTSAAAKLANHLKDNGLSVRLVACDTFRAAATEQLAFWAERINVPITVGKPEQDPASVAYAGIETAMQNNEDVVIVDTAGRLHNNSSLMDELARMQRVMKKLLPDAPHAVTLVLDTLSGHTLTTQTQSFVDNTHVNSIILTKMDSTSKGGAIFSIAQRFQVPICAITSGENVEAIQRFECQAFVDRLFSN